jgi:hypothetical protein
MDKNFLESLKFFGFSWETALKANYDSLKIWINHYFETFTKAAHHSTFLKLI